MPVTGPHAGDLGRHDHGTVAADPVEAVATDRVFSVLEICHVALKGVRVVASLGGLDQVLETGLAGV